jgi:predicted membrane-bound mannosyltransferase/DNA-binding beta-propeller fold protein YncE
MALKSLGRWERTLYLLILVAAILSRFIMLGDRAMSHDESIHTKFAWNFYAGDGFQHNPMMHGPLLFEATAFSYFVFGVSDFTARLFVAGVGVLLVMSPLLFRQWLSPTGSLVATFLMLISPSISYYSRYIRHDVLLMFSAIVLLWTILKYLEEGQSFWLYLLAGAFATMYATKEASYFYTAIFGGLLVLPFVWQVARVHWQTPHLQPALLFLLALTIASLGILAWSFRESTSVEIDLDDSGNSQMSEIQIPVWGRAATGSALLLGLTAVVVTYYGVGPKVMAQIKLFDVLMVIGTLTLPLGTALLIRFVLGMDMNVVYEAVRTGNFGAISTQLLIQMGFVVFAVLLLSTALGLWWNRCVWIKVGIIHYVIFLTLYTTLFTWGFGALSGLIGGLAYWLSQHGVKRGNQPTYYYLFVGGLYEYLPMIGSLGALGALVTRVLKGQSYRGDRTVSPDQPPVLNWSDWFPFLLAGWTLLSWIAYTVAGEKMPWLLVHIAFPSIFLTAWWAGRLIDRVRRRWDTTVSVALPMLCIGGIVLIVAWITLGRAIGDLRQALGNGVSPAGLSLSQLNAWGRLLGALLLILLSGVAVVLLGKRLSWGRAVSGLAVCGFLVLVALTIRTSFMLNFENPGLAKEFLVYAHGTPDIKVALDQIEDVSWHATGTARNVQVAYGEDGSWPFAWYMVHFPNNYFYSTAPDSERLLASPVVIAGQPEYEAVEAILGDAYVSFDYLYLWWPIQDYYNLDFDRIWEAVTDREMRSALWDIAWDRDYRAYARLKNPDSPFTLKQWPYRKSFRLYVRQEIAEVMWLPSDSVQGSAVVRPEPTELPDPFDAGARTLPLDMQQALPNATLRGVAISEDGTRYVTDTANHRIWILHPDGTIDSIGEFGNEAGQFSEPWDVAVDSRGNLYVADTWNHRIQKFDTNGQFQTMWGSMVQIRDLGNPSSQGLFFGPRGLTISSDDELYVTDTGNKRVQVFDLEGRFLREFGGTGRAPGQLDEPVGIAINDEGLVAVADTWNRRVQLFTQEGTIIRQWDIPTWDISNPDEKPFVALTQDTVFVTDPLHRRVLAFALTGEFQWALSASAGADLLFPQGLAVEGETLIVTDAHGGGLKTYALPSP